MSELQPINMKAVEMAASSNDPRVRNIALRRLKINNEIVQLDAFLAFYESENVEAESSGAEKKTKVNLKSDSSGKSGTTKTALMIDVICDTISANKNPMPLGTIYSYLKTHHPDLCPATPTAMRVRLSEHRDRVSRIDARGYWLTNKEVPATHE